MAYTLLTYAGLIAVIVSVIFTFKKRIGFIQGVLFAAVSFVISFIASVMALNAEIGGNVIDMIINNQFDSLLSVVTAMGEEVVKSTYGVTLAQIKEALEGVKEMYSLIFPATIVISSLTMSYLLFMVIKTGLRLFRRDVSSYTDFVMLKMPKSAMFVLLISTIISLTVKNTIGSAFLNMTVVLIFATMVCGLSCILYLAKIRTKTKPSRYLAYFCIVAAVFILSGFSSYILGMAAITDAFINIRNPRIKGGFDE